MKFELNPELPKEVPNVMVSDLNVGQALRYKNSLNIVVRLSNTVYAKIFDKESISPIFQHFGPSEHYLLNSQFGSDNAELLPAGTSFKLTI